MYVFVCKAPLHISFIEVCAIEMLLLLLLLLLNMTCVNRIMSMRSQDMLIVNLNSTYCHSSDPPLIHVPLK